MKKHDPIVVIGPPRSGTTLMAKILEIYGVFMGFNCNNAWEDWFFININEHIMDRLDIYWDRGKRPDESWTPPVDRVVKEIEESATWKKIDIPWGFKDPRTTLCVDVWEEVFEELDVDPTWIRMTRHPMDVAYSLFRREKEKMQENPQLLHAKEPMNRGLGNDEIRTYPLVSKRCLTLEGALQKAYESLNMFKEKGWNVSFEELVTQPEEVLPGLSEKIGIPVDTHRLECIGNLVNQKRAFAYEDNKKLRDFWEKNKR